MIENGIGDRPLNIRHFAALAATVRHGSLTRAARAVNLTQPALTQAIAGLEASLGVTLFERSAQGMTATEPALLMAPRAEAAIDHIGSPRVTGTQLRALLALARAGSYAGAAEATGLSSASLHRAVADLQVALGQRLVDRRGQHVALTPTGQRRARGFGLAMAELRAGLAEVATWQGKAAGRIIVGAMPLSRARWLPEAISRFAREYPGVGVMVVEGSHGELSGPLRDGEIDLMLGALREGAEAEGLAGEAVFADTPVLVMRKGHPLESVAEPGAELADYPWILPGSETPLRRHWQTMLRALGAEPPRVAIECGSVMTIRQLLLDSDSLTLLSRSQVAVELDAGVLTARDLVSGFTRSIGITTRAGWRPTATQEAFVAMLRECGAGQS
ncbi:MULTISPECIES: LysR family transcriptional regulator [unclassified Novosphingobium]|uniref:LysR family transcriptional regulator n=1 Tax=unclassified Novosphingobium TaxID=2644732 RepID=UPI00086EABA5|nr:MULTISPECIES: LysR family transcriptional regulator [unclassified Novosphingobium]MBN9144831.1 LysR family transcriptional regulator [Novosphingobium sp.]MDR6708074.1 DNA-binding transcriptional LysR family regulator [Novosphingobium sp. 1748]NKJ00570.1 DNA-binding transcriptional LysR family regulator [Novosphingobium sp. SG707]ODU82160.1 MAG: LysR family transcriptional regulator [Novosphingobium sp. SCN 63-17]OJX92245.1 MAG: LysR family transcriptional regulator [Novosphingobium sp. 63-7